jgi:hypothetical protein
MDNELILDDGLPAHLHEKRKKSAKVHSLIEEFDAKTYFGIFDREFFRVTKKEFKKQLPYDDFTVDTK